MLKKCNIALSIHKSFMLYEDFHIANRLYIEAYLV